MKYLMQATLPYSVKDVHKQNSGVEVDSLTPLVNFVL